MRGSIFALFIASLFGCALSQCPAVYDFPSQCHYNCSDLVCTSHSAPHITSYIKINQCSDPLSLTLTAQVSGSIVTQEYLVGGPQQVSSSCSEHGVVQLHSTWSRNTTHLTFSVMGIYQGDIAIDMVPAVSLPLTPHLCMCQSMESVADSFSLNIPFFPYPYNCSRDQDCTSVVCTFQIPDVGDVPLKLTFDPCLETVSVPGGDSTAGMTVFNQTEERDFQQESFSGTMHVTLTNHNYSMDFSLDVSLGGLGQDIQLFPLSRVLLDRSSCGGDLTYYPGPPTPADMCTPGGTGGVPPVTTTTQTPPPVTTPAHPISCPPMAVPSSCQLLPDCSSLSCSSHFTRAVLVVDKCSDPLTVDLTITGTGSSSPMYRFRHFVGGPERVSHRDPVSEISVYYNRNSSHLNFTGMGVFEGDIADLIIPDIEFPLDPHTCSCQALSTTASKISLPFVPGLSVGLNCNMDQICSSIDCTFTENSSPLGTFNVVFHPCHEIVILTPPTGTVGQVIFNQTESRPFVETGFNTTAEATLHNHNYSMEFQLDLVVQILPIPLTIFPLSQVSLDRSSCDSSTLHYYSGDPPEPINYIPVPTSKPIPVTAIAVSVPVLFVFSLFVIVVVVVCVVVSLQRKKRSPSVYSFKQLTDDEDDDPDA